MFTYRAKSFSIGLLGDSHNQNDKIDAILEKHPEITEWFHLGDLTSFQHPQSNKNRDTEKWYFENKSKFIAFLKSNHDHVCAKGFINISYDFAWALAAHPKQVQIILPDQSELFLFHSKPNDFWEFTEKTITEREFVDEYPSDSPVRACVIGHNHSAFLKKFVDTDVELWSIGAVQQGSYAILTEKGIEFKRL